MLNKKSAMFGLDARIALAIFGALSVITGAVLVNAMKSLDVGKWTMHFEECVKASEEYYLDNGSYLPLFNKTAGLEVKRLFKNKYNKKVWKGPYFQTISYDYTNWKDSMTAQFSKRAEMNIFLQKKSEWTSTGPDLSIDACVVNDSDCVEWIVLSVVQFADTEPDAFIRLVKLAKLLDSSIDGGDGFKKGRIRYIYSIGMQYLMYQGIPHKRLK